MVLELDKGAKKGNGFKHRVELRSSMKCGVDIETGNFEVDETVVAATNRLYERNPDAQPFGIRIGHRAVYHFGSRSLRKT